jgi:hypothetical protein
MKTADSWNMRESMALAEVEQHKTTATLPRKTSAQERTRKLPGSSWDMTEAAAMSEFRQHHPEQPIQEGQQADIHESNAMFYTTLQAGMRKTFDKAHRKSMERDAVQFKIPARQDVVA